MFGGPSDFHCQSGSPEAFLAWLTKESKLIVFVTYVVEDISIRNLEIYKVHNPLVTLAQVLLFLRLPLFIGPMFKVEGSKTRRKFESKLQVDCGLCRLSMMSCMPPKACQYCYGSLPYRALESTTAHHAKPKARRTQKAYSWTLIG